MELYLVNYFQLISNSYFT
ncbi:hypothetical protein Goshw_022625 [Gossypium schwendimanii]|uniref:Uncharacterized protein n=1 Tax=Gossypium schwendimanii TaxID=34291 RepID=A0A7J9N1Q2_GOSSC|nr:hypothetical protein [Gossypium schwendimanii]